MEKRVYEYICTRVCVGSVEYKCLLDRSQNGRDEIVDSTKITLLLIVKHRATTCQRVVVYA